MVETRYQRIGREQRERQAARETKQRETLKAERKAKRAARKPDTRTAVKIDGYDRDDTGLSHDY